MGRVLRGADVERVIPWEVAAARLDAAAIRHEATRGAERLLHAAETEASRRVAEAEANARAAAAAHAVRVRVELEAERARARANAERELVALAADIARRVVGDVLSRSPELVATRAEEAIARVQRAQRVVVRCAPDDVPRLLSALPIGAVAQPDETLAPGDVVVDTELGSVDARVEAQLDRLVRALSGELG